MQQFEVCGGGEADRRDLLLQPQSVQIVLAELRVAFTHTCCLTPTQPSCPPGGVSRRSDANREARLCGTSCTLTTSNLGYVGSCVT